MVKSFVKTIRRLFFSFRPPRRLKVTFLGKIVMGLSIVIGVAAINTGNNLLYLVLGILFGIIAASGLLSEEMVRDLELVLIPPSVVIAGRSFSIKAIVHSKKKVTTHLIEVALWMKGDPPPFRSFLGRVLGRRASRRKEIGFALLPTLPSHGKAELLIPITPLPKRGSFLIVEAELRTRFPFQFYEKIVPVPLSLTLYAAPSPRPPQNFPFLPEISRGKEGRRSFSPSSLIAAEEFFGLREFLPSDPISRVHWRRAVEPFPPMVKLFSGGGEPNLLLILGQGEDPEGFERGLEEVMGICEIFWRSHAPFILSAGERKIVSHTPLSQKAILLLLAQISREELPQGPVYRLS